MVLRIPRTVGDTSLLEDEPFKTRFLLRRPAAEGRNRKTRAVFYVDIEERMREEPGGVGFHACRLAQLPAGLIFFSIFQFYFPQLDAARAWLGAVFGTHEAPNSTQIDVFVQFFWLLHSAPSHVAKTYLCTTCKRMSFYRVVNLTDEIAALGAITDRQAPPRPAKRVKKLADAYDAEAEDNGTLLVVTKRATAATVPVPRVQPLNPSTTSSARPTSVSAATNSRKGRKRKAKKAHPSVNNQSSTSASEGHDTRILNVPDTTAMQSCIDSDSPLTPVSSDVEEEREVTPPMPMPSISAPARSNPVRRASKRDKLALMMQKETRYQNSRALSSDEDVAIEERDLPPLPSISAPLPRARKVKAKQRVSATKPSRKAVHSMTRRSAPLAPPQDPPKAPPADPSARDSTRTEPVVRVKNRSRSSGTRGAANRRAGSRKSNRKARAKKSRAESGPRPCKKSKHLHATDEASAVVVLYHPTLPAASSSSSSRQLVTSNNAAEVVNDNGKTHRVRAEKRSHKRAFEEATDDSSLVSRNGPTKFKVGRQIRPPPKIRLIIPPAKRKSLPASASASKHSLGMSAPAVDGVIRDAATAAMRVMDCTEEIASEWEAEDPDEGQPAQSSDDEDEDERDEALLSGRPSQSKKNAQKSGPHPAGSSARNGGAQGLVKHLHEVNVDQLVMFPKPPLPEYPPVWAQVSFSAQFCVSMLTVSQSRQEVCETFEPFRSYQGGVYFAKNVAKGYLLGGFSARSAHFFSFHTSRYTA